MLLSDRDILAAMVAGQLTIDPFDPRTVQPASVDVHIDQYFRVFNHATYTHIDPAERQDNLTSLVNVTPAGLFVLQPHEFALGNTVEVVTLGAGIAARFEGKALALDTEVPTPNGWTTIGQLQRGDWTIGSDGNPVRVRYVTDVLFNRDCYRIKFSDGRSVIADAQHLWSVESRVRRGFGPSQALTTEEIGKSVHYCKMARHRVATTATQGRDEVLPIDPYTLGVWLGDGTSAKAVVTLARRDSKEIINEMRSRGVRAEWRRSQPGAEQYLLGGGNYRQRDKLDRWTSDDSLNSTLDKLRLLGDKHIPEIYLRASFEQRWSLLQGLLDTDGYVNKRGNQTELTFTNQRLARDAAELIQSLGLVMTSDERPAKRNGRTVGMAYRARFRPVPTMFITSFRARRARATEEWTAGVIGGHRLIRGVDRTLTVPVRCIEVDSLDGIFLITRSFISTHNSSLGRLGLFAHATAGFIDPGFTGQITVELKNAAPLPTVVRPGMEIGQLCFFQLSSPAHRPYGSPGLRSRYQHQRGPTSFRTHSDD